MPHFPRCCSRAEVCGRELREEAQLQASDWTHLASSYASPGISQEVQHLYLARGLEPADRGDFELQHEEADMTWQWVAFAELYDAVLAGAYDHIRLFEMGKNKLRDDSGRQRFLFCLLPKEVVYERI